jgi:hypothetical protein
MYMSRYIFQDNTTQTFISSLLERNRAGISLAEITSHLTHFPPNGYIRRPYDHQDGDWEFPY